MIGTTPSELLANLVTRARTAGASAADAVFVDEISMSVSQRLGKREDLERAEGRDIGLRVFDGRRQATVSTTDTSPASLDELVDRVFAMAKAAPEDPYCGLADRELLAKDIPDLELADDDEPDSDELYSLAAEAEDAGRAINGVTNSNGAGADWSRRNWTLVTSDGFSGAYESSSRSVQASMVAGKGTAMEMDYAYSRARFADDLDPAAKIGTEAGERSVRRLNPQKVKSGPMPVVFEPRVANSMLRHVAQAISGPAIARKTSFLRNEMDKAIFGKEITIVDDPHRKRGLKSRPFDGEGAATRRMNLVESGMLKTWILSSDSGRQLGLPSTGHARRGTLAPPGPAPSNMYLEAGTASPEDLLGGIKRGVWITDLIGFGVNMVTGDYSRGAAGALIHNGELAGPVSEFTIAGNLKEMFRAITPANNLVFRYGTDAPTLRVDGMTTAGK